MLRVGDFLENSAQRDRQRRRSSRSSRARSRLQPSGERREARRRVTEALVSSRSASLPTHRAEGSVDSARRRAITIAAALRAGLRFPIARKAMFTAFFTK